MQSTQKFSPQILTYLPILYSTTSSKSSPRLLYLFNIELMSLQLLSCIVLSLLLPEPSSQTSNSVSVCQNKKYVNSGTAKVDIASAVTWNPYSVNVTYAFSFSSSPVLGVFLSISDMNINNSSAIQNISFYGLVDSFSQTSFVLNLYSNTSSIITTLGYRYMAFALQDSMTFGWILITFVQGLNLNLSNTYCLTYGVSINLPSNYTFGFSQLNQYAISFLGYDFSVANSQNSSFYEYLQFGIELNEGWYKNVTNLTAQIKPCILNSYWSYNHQYFNLNTIHFNILIHNRSQDTALPYIRSHYYNLSGSDYNNLVYSYQGYSQYDSCCFNKPNYYGLIYGPSTLYSVNYTKIWGVGQSSVYIPQYSVSVNDYSLNFTSSYYNNFGVTITSFYTYYCPFTTPYLLNSSCYDVCPSGTQSKQSELICQGNSTNNNSSTQSTETGQINLGFQVGSILGYIGFFLILILIVAVFCLYKKRSTHQASTKYQKSRETPYIYDQVANNSRTQINNKTTIQDQKPQIGVWRQKSMDSLQKCSICHKEQTNFKTHCGHSFHTKCIVTWSQKYDKCPNCKTGQLTKKPHRVFCRFCKESEKWLNFNELRQKYGEGIHSEEFICPTCLIDPL